MTTDVSGNYVTTIANTAFDLAISGTIAFTRASSSPFSVALNVVANYALTGKVLMIQIPSLAAAFGGSTATQFSFNAISSAFWPINDIAGRLIALFGTGEEQFGKYYMSAAGVLTIALDSGEWSSGASNGFFGFFMSFPIV